MIVASYIYNVIINLCSKAEDPADCKAGACKVFEEMKLANVATEQTKKKAVAVGEPIYSAMIKLCSKASDFEACEALVAEMEEAKVVPKLRTFGPLLQAHSDAGNLDKCIWVHEKLLSHELELTEDDYVALLRVCVKTGHAEQFYAFLDRFIDEIWQPSLSTWDVLKDWFSSEAAQVDGRKWTITEGTVNKQGVCSVTSNQLQSVELSPELDEELLVKIEKLVRTDEKRIAQWDDFKQWLEKYGPFEVLIDAANVGYCNQNFQGGGFDYGQIKLMVQHYEAKGKKVLIVLHERRISDEQVPVKHRAQIVQWGVSHNMFNCQPGNNDDWYWLYAAVKLGKRTLLVTNDEMRDHHFQMIHNRAFARWKERHQVRYQVHGRRVTVDEPLPYSERPQRVGNVWHFPSREFPDQVSDSDRRWLCVELQQTA
uniref:Mitochondrial ribonuclease P catalytic subunit n=1 Tax=Hyaloperonospora arabidopsidis (strain Emoy2) TaxID=559515 RepID=M4BWN3_HYAAE